MWFTAFHKDYKHTEKKEDTLYVTVFTKNYECLFLEKQTYKLGDWSYFVCLSKLHWMQNKLLTKFTKMSEMRSSMFNVQLTKLWYCSTYWLAHFNLNIPINMRKYFRLIDFWASHANPPRTHLESAKTMEWALTMRCWTLLSGWQSCWPERNWTSVSTYWSSFAPFFASSPGSLGFGWSGRVGFLNRINKF